MKFLGVMLDKNLSFRAHGSSVISRLSRSLGIIRKVSSLIPPVIRKKLYFRHFYSHISYALTAWGNVSKVDCDRIIKLQDHVVKLIEADYVGDVFSKYKILKFNNIYKLSCLVKFYKILHGHHDHFARRIASFQISHSHVTRNQTNEHLTNYYCRTSCSQQNFLYHAIDFWNRLPLSIRNSPNILTFKNLVKRHLLFDQ